MNICKLSLVIILQRYSQSLPYSIFRMCWVHWYEFTSRFASIKGRVYLINNLLQTSYCTLFFVWVFFLGFLLYKVFNEAISTQDYVISSIFLHRGFWRVILWHILCKLSIYGFSYKVFDEAISTQRYMLYHLVFLTGVFGRWYLKHIDPMVKVFLD